MNASSKPPTMDQQIFKLGLSVETVSVYLLCCGLADAAADISTKKLLDTWNGTKAELLKGLDALEARNIIKKFISDRQENNVYQLVAVEKWRNG